MQISGRAPELSLEQREKRTLAKRIIRAIQPALEDAIKKESELNRKPFEQELKELDLMLETSVLSRRDSEIDPADIQGLEGPPEEAQKTGGSDEKQEGEVNIVAKPEPRDTAEATGVPAQVQEDTVMPDVDNADAPDPTAEPQTEDASQAEPVAPAAQEAESQDVDMATASTDVFPTTEGEQPAINGETSKTEQESPQRAKDSNHEPTKGPLTPPPSFKGDQQLPLSQGGIQWYMQPFDPVGTTIHEERWTGRDVMRGMSEELSELDEDELKDLVGDELEGQIVTAPDGSSTHGTDGSVNGQDAKVHRTRRRWRGFK